MHCLDVDEYTRCLIRFVPMWPQDRMLELAPNADMRFAWQPRYFTGLDADGRPRVSAREVDAHPLNLDADMPGEQPEELRDVVGQMGISWVPSLAAVLFTPRAMVRGSPG